MNECRVGLYSFPKCGNTWLRAIVAAMVGIPQEPDDLQKYLTDIYQGTPYQHPWEHQGRRWLFYKAHHNHVLTEFKGQPLETDKVIYIYRHPLDAFVSYLNFASAQVAWKAAAQRTVDSAQTRYFIAHLHRLMDGDSDARQGA